MFLKLSFSNGGQGGLSPFCLEGRNNRIKLSGLANEASPLDSNQKAERASSVKNSRGEVGGSLAHTAERSPHQCLKDTPSAQWPLNGNVDDIVCL
jgi:hypothetical protein